MHDMERITQLHRGITPQIVQLNQPGAVIDAIDVPPSEK
jgi:hypothetical protein